MWARRACQRGDRALHCEPCRRQPRPPLWAQLFPDLLRAVGSWSWLEGLVPRGFHSARDGILWSLELGHLHVGLTVGCGTWGLRGKRGSDRLCRQAVLPEGKGPALDSEFQVLSHCICVSGPFCLQTVTVGLTPVRWSPLPQPYCGSAAPACASPGLIPCVCDRDPFQQGHCWGPEGRGLGWMVGQLCSSSSRAHAHLSLSTGSVCGRSPAPRNRTAHFSPLRLLQAPM